MCTSHAGRSGARNVLWPAHAAIVRTFASTYALAVASPPSDLSRNRNLHRTAWRAARTVPSVPARDRPMGTSLIAIFGLRAMQGRRSRPIWAVTRNRGSSSAAPASTRAYWLRATSLKVTTSRRSSVHSGSLGRVGLWLGHPRQPHGGTARGVVRLGVRASRGPGRARGNTMVPQVSTSPVQEDDADGITLASGPGKISVW